MTLPTATDLSSLRWNLVELAPNRRHIMRTGTKLTKAAYLKGVDAEGNGHTVDDCPYGKKHSLPNFMRGNNDPRDAWQLGWRDADRVRRMINNPTEDFPGLTFFEAKALSDAGLLERA